MKKIYALIIAKGESERLKDKNKLLFKGKPMFVWNLEKCNKLFDKVFVSSDDREILRIAKENGAITIKRPKRLCKGPNIPVYKHAQRKMKADVIVAVQANSPTIDPDIILATEKIMRVDYWKELITQHLDTKIYGSVWAMTKERLENYRDPYLPKDDPLMFYFLDPSTDIHTLKDFKYAEKISKI